MCVINYGKTIYDVDEETVVSFAPGRTVGIHRLEDGPAGSRRVAVPSRFPAPRFAGAANGAVLVFSYASNEALHLSTDERFILQDYMEKIVRELQHPSDKFSRSLIVSNIEVLLNYCMRFYERQFIPYGMNRNFSSPYVEILRICLSASLRSESAMRLWKRSRRESVSYRFTDLLSYRRLDLQVPNIVQSICKDLRTK